VDLFVSGSGQLAGCCELGNESVFNNIGKFFY
jgi:hypothetical protein